MIDYNELPELFKKFFTEEEYNFSNDYEEKDMTYDATGSMVDFLDESIFNYSEYSFLIRSLGFDGPDDDSIISCFKNIEDDYLILRGTFRFCIYGDLTIDKFYNLIDKLEAYTHTDNKIGTFSITEAHPAADTYGISMDAIRNTDDTRWIAAKYRFEYKIGD